MSYNNFLDANSALELVKEFDDITVVIVKHNNPLWCRSRCHLRGSLRTCQGKRILYRPLGA